MKLVNLHVLRLFLVVVSVAAFMTACNKTESPVSLTSKTTSEYDHDAISDWNEMLLEVERFQAGYRPGPAPRAIAYIGLASYEACINGMPNHNSIAYLYPNLKIPAADKSAVYHWPTVINAVYSTLLTRFFPGASENIKSQITALEHGKDQTAKDELDLDVFNRSKDYGTAVAETVWNYSKTDVVGHDHYLDPFKNYDWQVHYQKDGDWKPTFPGPGKAMFGDWGNARTFAINESERLCRKPLEYSAATQSQLYAQAFEVYVQNTPTLSYENEWVGEFWSDDLVNVTFSPGPRWLAIGDQALINEKSDLETAIEMTAKVGLALNDANVACWYSKYYYNIERPQTYINRLIDPNWKPALINPLTGEEGVTPSFPAFPSGHSTMGAAGAEVLASVFGYAYGMTDRCHEDRTEFEGKPRSFGSFFEMAQENAWSRVPLGVHFRMDADEGVRFGTEIGRKVNALPWRK